MKFLKHFNSEPSIHLQNVLLKGKIYSLAEAEQIEECRSLFIEELEEDSTEQLVA